jgi:hypothetical protein
VLKGAVVNDVFEAMALAVRAVPCFSEPQQRFVTAAGALNDDDFH